MFVILSGCGYRLGYMTVGGIKTISIAAINNQTGRSFIEEALVTNSLIEEFNRDSTVRVTAIDLSEAVLTVTLTQYNQRAEVFSAQDVGEQFRLLINAEITVKRKNSDTVLYEGAIQGEAFYNTGLDQSEIERTTTRTAITDLSIDIVRAILEGGW